MPIELPRSRRMRVISIARLKLYWENHGVSEGPLRAWHSHVSNRKVAWQSWGDVKGDFASASIVGKCVVFNIGGNKYRLITRILYPSQKVFILKVMTHTEYDDDKWKSECGCFDAPPVKKSVVGRTVTKGKATNKGAGKKRG
jgi:mRNA interferase HigB